MPTTPPPNTPAPELPIRHVKATFSDRVDAFVTWFVAAMAQAYALALNCFNNAKEAFDSSVVAANWAGIATDKALEATQRAANANDAVIAAAAAVNAAPWASGSTYQQFQRVLSPVNFKIYVKTTTASSSSGGATDPANDPTNWQQTGLSSMPGGKRTSNSMLKIADMGSYIELSGTFTQTFDAPAALGNGWCMWLRNSGTGDITIPSSDGRTNWIMYPGEARLFQCDGVTLRSMVVRPFFKTFTSTQNFVKPPGYGYFEGVLWGAGANGVLSTKNDVITASGSGGGAAHPFSVPADLLLEVELVTIAATVPGITGSGETTFPGTAGGTSSFAGFIANGGKPGGFWFGTTGGSALPGDGGKSNNTGTPADGGAGGGAAWTSAGPGVSTYLSGAGSAGTGERNANDPVQPPSGTSRLGGAAGASIKATSATQVVAGDGVAPGGAGGACCARGPSNATAYGRSGAGARGELRIWGKN